VSTLPEVNVHQRLSLAIAVSDLRYSAGSLLDAIEHPRSWPFTQWATMVAFEAQKHVRDVHQCEVEAGWEEMVASAARHGGKFFDGRRRQLDNVVEDFRELTEATHRAFYPHDRRGRFFDFLRNDLSVVGDGREVVLTNVSGHFMVGLPPDRGIDMQSWGPHLDTLGAGIGQITRAFLGNSAAEVSEHGSRSSTSLKWWDGKVAEVRSAIFGGELDTELAMAVISIHSTVQAARRWAHAECCADCSAASLKHRFVVLHHAIRSLHQLSPRSEQLGRTAQKHLGGIVESTALQLLVEQPFRRLRNGWFHLGLGDIESKLPADPSLTAPVAAYTGMDTEAFSAAVHRGLDEVSWRVGDWLNEPGADGTTLFKRLRLVDVTR